jgi:hypothetical protein
MGQTVEQIEAYIENRREELGSNLNELGQKVESVTDWREHFQRRPLAMLGIAFGTGVLMSVSMARRTSPRTRATAPPSPEAGRSHNGQHEEALELWHNIKGALFGLAATRLTAYVDEMLPGFDEHFERTRAQRQA